jgi:hypothetical protein
MIQKAIITDRYGYAHQRDEYYIKPFHDDGGPITFSWAFPRGTFDQLMSIRELAEFLLPHMPCILPFFVAIQAFWTDDTQTALRLQWNCPGCGGGLGSDTNVVHEIIIADGKHWWNKDTVRVTLSPSVKFVDGEGLHRRVCHSTIKHGEIRFHDDCTHMLAGQTVDLGHPRVYEEFAALTSVVVGDLTNQIDRVLPYIKTVVKGGAGDDWDYVVLDLRAKPEEIKRPRHYV